jgi:hypothetical protein
MFALLPKAFDLVYHHAPDTNRGKRVGNCIEHHWFDAVTIFVVRFVAALFH